MNNSLQIRGTRKLDIDKAIETDQGERENSQQMEDHKGREGGPGMNPGAFAEARLC